MDERRQHDKWIHLELFQTQLEQMGHNTNIIKTVINTGKIYLKTTLLEDELQEQNGKKNINDNFTVYSTASLAVTQALKNNLKNLSYTKDKVNANKTEKFRSICEHNNEFLKNLKNKKDIPIEELYEDIEEELGKFLYN
jgi:hypothetical protein